MKKIYLFIGVFNTFLLSAQVGIGTTTPKATLDILATNETGNSTLVDGIIIPRVDSERALSMENIPVSTLVYINEVKPNTNTGKARNINEKGYYYFDGNLWINLNTNIYTKDGSLSTNRVVTLNDKSLIFKSTGVDGLVHERRATHDYAPSYLVLRRNNTDDLSANGAVKKGQHIGVVKFKGNTGNGYEGSSTSSGAAFLAIAAEDFSTTTQGTHLELKTVPVGTAEYKTSMRISSEGNVGINTESPSEKLDIEGKLRVRDISQLTSTNTTSLYVDENGVVGKAAPKIAIINSSLEPVSSDKYNNAELIEVPISNHFNIRNSNYTLTNEGKLKINSDGYYQLTSSMQIEFMREDPQATDYIWMKTGINLTRDGKTQNLSLTNDIIPIPYLRASNLRNVLNTVVYEFKKDDEISFSVQRETTGGGQVLGKSASSLRMSPSLSIIKI